MSGVQALASRFGHAGAAAPEAVATRAAELAGVPVRSASQRRALTAALHAGFGVGAGALYGALPKRPPAVLYATGIYAVSYAGWVPALGAMPPPSRDDPRRQVATLVAHLVYGAVLGQVMNRWARR